MTASGGGYPEGSQVMARYPLTPEQEHGDRAAWPWLPGTVLSQCGPDEWDVMVEARELATLDDGTPAPPGTPGDEMLCPLAFWDAGEIRAREEVE
jgi:hypothetical protein